MTAASTGRRLGLALALLAVALSIDACGTRRRGEPFAGPVQVGDASVERGRKLFDENCFKCHTQGEGGMGPIINDKPFPRALMRFQVRHGLGVMPAFPPERLSDQDVDDILDYLLVLRHQAPR